MRKERLLYERFKPAAQIKHFVERVENSAAEGMPDVQLTCRETGVLRMIELKRILALPKRPTTRVFGDLNGLRPMQVAWLHCRAVVGAPVFILAQADDLIVLLHGGHARTFNQQTRSQLTSNARFSHTGDMSPALWGALLQALGAQ